MMAEIGRGKSSTAYAEARPNKNQQRSLQGLGSTGQTMRSSSPDIKYLLVSADGIRATIEGFSTT